MTAIAAAGILSGGIGAAKFVSGLSQKKQAEKLAANNKFQDERLPGEVQLATNLAAQNYYNGLPGQAQAKQNIMTNGANSFAQGAQGASSGGDILDLATKINYGQNVATNDLAQKGAQYKAQALGGYQNALDNQGQWQDKLYQNNVLQPYLRTANTAASLYGAGAQNQFSGLDQIGTAALGYASGLERQQDSPYTMGQVTGSPQLPSATGVGISQPSSIYGNPNFAAALAGANLKKRGY